VIGTGAKDLPMSVSSVTTFGSAAIASPPANVSANVKQDEALSPGKQITEAAKSPGTGQFVDVKV
jgi:hypothetical protein